MSQVKADFSVRQRVGRKHIAAHSVARTAESWPNTRSAVDERSQGRGF